MSEELKAKYVGYSCFQDKDKTKIFYVIEVLLQEVAKDKKFVKSIIKNIFVDEDFYNTIINSVQPFDNIDVVRYVNTANDKVYYKIK